MKASVVKGILAFVVLGFPTSADAHKLKQVRRELMLKGYDQIEFTQTKFPVWVNACRGSKRLHLHVDWYGKVTVTNDTPTGSCPTEAGNTIEADAQPRDERKTEAGNENSTISAASMERDKTVGENTVGTETEPKDEPESVDCKKFFPSIGRSLTVACE